LCFPKRPDRLWDPPSLPFNGHLGSFLGIKQLEREVNHTLPCNDEVKNEWNYISTRLYAFMARTGITYVSLVHEHFMPDSTVGDRQN
jgi:hypothetical protein